MKKIIYTTINGTVSIVNPSAKERIEIVLGPLTDEQYRAIVYEKSIPADAINVREIDDIDIPATREFRGAWVDVTAETRVDVSIPKAREIQLEKLRLERNKELDRLDKELLKAQELEQVEAVTTIKAQKQTLRNATDALKALDIAADLVNDDIKLAQIRSLGVL